MPAQMAEAGDRAWGRDGGFECAWCMHRHVGVAVDVKGSVDASQPLARIVSA